MQLTEAELKMIAHQRAYKANKTLKKGMLCAGALLPLVILEMWLVYSKIIGTNWAWGIFAVIMVTLWTIYYFIRKKEVELSTEILKELRQGNAGP